MTRLFATIALITLPTFAFAAPKEAPKPDGAFVVVLDGVEPPPVQLRLKAFRKIFKKERHVISGRDLGTVFCFGYTDDIDEDLVKSILTGYGLVIGDTRRTEGCDRPPGEAFRTRSSIVDRWEVKLSDPMPEADLKILLLGILQQGLPIAELLIPRGETKHFCVSFDMAPDETRWRGALSVAGIPVSEIEHVDACAQ